MFVVKGLAAWLGFCETGISVCTTFFHVTEAKQWFIVCSQTKYLLVIQETKVKEGILYPFMWFNKLSEKFLGISSFFCL